MRGRRAPVSGINTEMAPTDSWARLLVDTYGTATASMLDDAASRRRNSHGPKEGPADKGFQEREQERQAFERETAASKRAAAVEVSLCRS